MTGTHRGEPGGFAAQLIAALEEAQASQGRQQQPGALAARAWEALQFDFPMVSAEELAALTDEYATGARHTVNRRFLAVLRESAATAPQPPEPAPPQPAEEAAGRAVTALVPLYQQLLAVAVLQSLLSCLEAPSDAAAAQLAGLQPDTPLLSAACDSRLEGVLAAAAAGAAGDEIELEHRLSQQEDDEGTAYESLDAPRQAAQPASAASGEPGQGPAATAALPDLLAELAGHLSYHCVADAAAWRDRRLLRRVAACLAAARRHPLFLELEGVAQPLLLLAAERLAAAPVEVEAGLPLLLDALGVPGATAVPGSSINGGADNPKVESAAAELALGMAVALAAQVASPPARRLLWQQVQQRLLPLAARQLEQQQLALARLAKNAAHGAVQPGPQQLYRIALPCQLVYFFVLQAPAAALLPPPGAAAGASLVHEALLRGGLLRSLVLLFVQLADQRGVEPLRCALLLACAAAQPLAEWAAAVPGFGAAVAGPALQPGGDAQLHGALWQVLLGPGGGQLAALLQDAQPADKVPGVYAALQLMADMQAVSLRRSPLWDSSVDSALRALAATLRQHYSKPRQEAESVAAAAAAADVSLAGVHAGSSSSDDEAAVAAHDARDARKLAVGAAEQAALLAARRAQQLQPACLKLVKDLLQRPAGGGASAAGSKHD